MQPSSDYTGKSTAFWGSVRFVSQELGYSDRSDDEQRMRRYSYAEVAKTLSEYNEDKERCEDVSEYLNYRSDLIESEVSSLLMTPDEAEREYDRMKGKHSPNSYMHLNK